MTVAAPHREAEVAGAAVLAEGGNAIEAAVAMAAALTVAYPHMTGLGGDGFWLIAEPGKPPLGIRACGPSAAAANQDWYRSRGFTAIPARGPEAALTVAGAVSGWSLALELSKSWGGSLPLTRLFADARALALRGVSVSRSQAALMRAKTDLHPLPGFGKPLGHTGCRPREPCRFILAGPLCLTGWPERVSTTFIAAMWPARWAPIWPPWAVR